jgi:hypothetical protein
MPPDRLLRSRPTHSAGLRWRTEASPSDRWLATTKDRIEFVSYGPIVHLLVLSTPSREDAVPLGYGGQAGRRQGLSPCGFNPLTIAQPAALRPVGLYEPGSPKTFVHLLCRTGLPVCLIFFFGGGGESLVFPG